MAKRLKTTCALNGAEVVHARVTSDGPQESVLETVFFSICINNSDDESINNTLSTFTNITKTGKPVLFKEK